MEAHPKFAERYRAVQSRDARFDGQFFFAVASTGIYCRPSCPARTPKPENVTFYTTSAAAHEAGYRACKKCLPEATAGTPEWNIRQDVAARAMRLIRQGVMDDGGTEALSARLGYSTRHIHRVLTAELGAGPLALARAHRAQTARTLLSATDLPISETAFAAGFSSVRQFNETLRTVFDASPSDVRARAGRRPSAEQPAGPARVSQHRLHLELQLPLRQPFDAPGTFRFLAKRALPGVETAELTSQRLIYARTLRLAHGPAAIELAAAAHNGSWSVQLRCELSSLADAPAAVAAGRDLLDLDADPAGIDAALGEDPDLALLVKHTAGVRVPGTADPEEYLIRAIVGQQISVAAARTHLSRLASSAGTPYDSAFEGLTTLFPSTEEILTAVPPPGQKGETPDPDRPLRLPARSIRTVREASAAALAGQLSVHRGADPSTLHQQLTAIPGIGEWTAAYLSLRVLNHPDTWMTGDVALVAGAKHLGLLDAAAPTSACHRNLAEHAHRWSPWRSYAAMHLWNAAQPRRKGPRR